MRILLLGKNGQIGAALAHLSRKREHVVLAFEKKELNIYHVKEIRDRILKFKPDVVINATAYHAVPECEKYPEKAFIVNVVAVKNIAQTCSGAGIRFVNYSTSWVFDGDKKSSYTENDRPNPKQVYGLSKFAGEMASSTYNQDSIIIRTCGVFGGRTGSRQKKGNFVLYILKEAKSKTTLEISAEQTTSITYAEDLAAATLQLLEKKVSPGIYHLVNSGYCSWAKVAQEIVRLRKLDLTIVPVNREGVFKGIQTPIMSSLKNTKGRSYGVVLPPWKAALKNYLVILP